MNIMCLNHPETIPLPCLSMWKNCLPQNWLLVSKRLGTTEFYTLHLRVWKYHDIWSQKA